MLSNKEKCRLWRTKGMEVKDIARYLCLSRGVVAKYCRGITKHYPTWRTSHAMVKKRNGCTTYEIAQHYGKSETWVNNRFENWRKKNCVKNDKICFEGLPSVGFMGMQL